MEQQYLNIHQKLIDRCRNGDQVALFEIYKLYYRAMYNTSLHIVNSREDAEDIMQEAFLDAFRKIHTYSGTVSFGAWLKRIVINRSIDYLKKRRVILEELNANAQYEEYEVPVEEPAGLSPKEVKEAMNELPDGYRIVLSLILLEGYDHEEVSQILGIENASSRSQFLRGKKKLRQIILERRNHELATG